VKISTTDGTSEEVGSLALGANRVVLIVLCHLALLLFALYFGGISVVLPSIGKSFHLGADVEGRLFPASFAGFIIGVLACGFLSDRWGRKAVLVAAMAAYALGLVLTSAAPHFALVCLAAALIGAGSGSIETVATALAADLAPDRRALLMNSVQVAFGVGAAIGPYVASVAIGRGLDWRALYISVAVCQAALLLVLALQRMPPLAAGSEAVDLQALKRLLSQPIFLAFCLAEALYVGAEVAFAGWMPTYFNEDVPDGAKWSGAVVTVFWIAITIGRVAVCKLIDHIPVLRLAVILSIGGAAGTALALIWTIPWIVIACVAWTGICFSGIFSLILAEGGEPYPTLGGSTCGAITASGGVGGAILPWLVSVLAATSLHWRGALIVVPVAIVALAFLLALLARRPVGVLAG
jgi:FHS family glucose/mannose:H+ symporter-like MFS transporter